MNTPRKEELPLSDQPMGEATPDAGAAPVFIHSLFRTGSTWLWQKLRDLPGLCAYYEPFHHMLLTLTPKQREGFVYDDEATGRMKHPSLSRPHFDEYGDLLDSSAGGLPLFRKSFCYDEYGENGDNPALKSYIDSLIAGAAPSRPLLQFNRSALRCRWFREAYPGAFSLYLLRNPRDQWQSFVNMKDGEGIDVFLVLDLLIASVNRRREPFRRLAAELPLFAFHSPRYAEEEAFYRHLLPRYTAAESYRLFFYHWLAALAEGLGHTDVVVDMDRLHRDGDYRASLADIFAAKGLRGVSFEDAKPSSYESFSLTIPEMEDAELRAFSLFCGNGGETAARLEEHFAGWLPAFSHLRDGARPPVSGRPSAAVREAALEKAESALAGLHDLCRGGGAPGVWQKPRGARAFLRRLLGGE